jgi:pyruvate dehydrogenase E1 component alpha subunit
MKILLRNMMRIRKMEDLAAEFYTKEKIRGFLHLYSGEEAVATGVIAHLNEDDNLLSTYREHAHALLKGIEAKFIFSEMFGKVSGCSKGRGGSMHLYSREKRFFGGTAIVGAHVPHSVGLALGAKLLREKRKTVCFFGEGAMSEGVFYEALNMASLWSLPVLFCCENNQYAMGTHVKRSQSETDLVKKVRGFRVEGNSIDGMKVEEVYEGTKNAFQFMEEEKKPYFLECRTYRFRSHSMFDPELYRSKDEVKEWKKKCPIDNFKKSLCLSEEEILDMEREIEKEMKEAIVFAENSSLETWEDFLKDHHETYL